MIEQTFHAGEVALRIAAGPESGAPAVLLHGVARRWQDLLPIVPALAVRWHVHAVDFRGHGESGRAAAYRVIDYVGDVVAFLRGGLATPAVLIGHSLGAMVAAAVAAEAPECVRALVLEDPPFEMMGARLAETQYRDVFVAYRALAGSTRPVDELAASLAEVRVTPHGQARSIRLGDARDATALRFTAACLKRLDPAVLTPVLEGRWLDGYDVETTLESIACPTLLLQGDFAAGGALPDDVAARHAARIAHRTHVRMAGVGHQIHGSQPEAMMRLVVGFLESLD